MNPIITEIERRIGCCALSKPISTTKPLRHQPYARARLGEPVALAALKLAVEALEEVSAPSPHSLSWRILEAARERSAATLRAIAEKLGVKG